MLIAEFDFTSAVMLQGEDRVHRLGQSRHVTVAYLYANATVDGFMLALINRKQRIFDKACDGLADPDYLLRLSEASKPPDYEARPEHGSAALRGRYSEVGRS